MWTAILRVALEEKECHAKLSPVNNNYSYHYRDRVKQSETCEWKLMSFEDYFIKYLFLVLFPYRIKKYYENYYCLKSHFPHDSESSNFK